MPALTRVAIVLLGAAPANGEAVFCAYNCSVYGKPSPPGHCLQPDQVYQTNRSWLLLRTRYLEAVGLEPEPRVLPEWDSYKAGGMTWEGWFRVTAPPLGARSVLLGTYGSAHDTETYSFSSRRRHGSLWIDTAGALSLSTNVGSSGGSAAGPSIGDGLWHHVGVVWGGAGGVQVAISLNVVNLDFIKLLVNPPLLVAFEANMKEAIAARAHARPEDVSLALSDGSGSGSTRVTAVEATVNSPAAIASGKVLLLRQFEPLGIAVAGAANAVKESTQIEISPATIQVQGFSIPEIRSVGTGVLYVDGHPSDETITYAPGGDNIGMDGEFIIGGGSMNETVGAEIYRVRLWSTALTPSQVEQVQLCDPPPFNQLVGGPWPHGLQAYYPLNASTSNAAGAGFAALEPVHGGRFVTGGPCSYAACPPTSAKGCPLAPAGELRFDSPETCAAFADWSYCRAAGPSRGRPAAPILGGCHAGAG